MSAMQEPHWAHDSVGAGVDTTSDTQSLAFPVPTDTEAALEDFEGADAVLDVFGNLHDLGSGTSLDSETMELLRKDCAGDFADVSGPVCDGLAGASYCSPAAPEGSGGLSGGGSSVPPPTGGMVEGAAATCDAQLLGGGGWGAMRQQPQCMGAWAQQAQSGCWMPQSAGKAGPKIWAAVLQDGDGGKSCTVADLLQPAAASASGAAGAAGGSSNAFAAAGSDRVSKGVGCLPVYATLPADVVRARLHRLLVVRCIGVRPEDARAGGAAGVEEGAAAGSAGAKGGKGGWGGKGNTSGGDDGFGGQMVQVTAKRDSVVATFEFGKSWPCMSVKTGTGLAVTRRHPGLGSEPHWAHDSVGAGVDTTSDTQSLAFPVPTDTEAALEDFEGADAVLDVFGNLHDLGSGTSLDSETMELLRKDCAGDFADVSGPVCDGLAGASYCSPAAPEGSGGLSGGGSSVPPPTGGMDFEAVDPALALAHHNMSWRNPAEFRIVLTGNVDRAALEPLLCAYLATIPKTGLPPPKLPKVTPLPYSFPEEPVVEDVKAQITFPVSLSRPVAREELVWLSLVCRALETRLLQKMRFVAGDVYTERQNRHRPGGHSAASRTRFRARSRSPGPLKFNTAAMSAMQEPHWAHDSVGAGVDTTSDTQSLAFPVPTDTEAALEDFEGADAVLDVFGNLHDLGSGTSLDSETMELLRKDCAGDFADVSGPVCDGLAGASYCSPAAPEGSGGLSGGGSSVPPPTGGMVEGAAATCDAQLLGGGGWGAMRQQPQCMGAWAQQAQSGCWMPQSAGKAGPKIWAAVLQDGDGGKSCTVADLLQPAAASASGAAGAAGGSSNAFAAAGSDRVSKGVGCLPVYATLPADVVRARLHRLLVVRCIGVRPEDARAGGAAGVEEGAAAGSAGAKGGKGGWGGKGNTSGGDDGFGGQMVQVTAKRDSVVATFEFGKSWPCMYGLVRVLEWLLPRVDADALTASTKDGWCLLHTAARAGHGQAVEMVLRRCLKLGMFEPSALEAGTWVLLCDISHINKHYRRTNARGVLDAAMERKDTQLKALMTGLSLRYLRMGRLSLSGMDTTD
eukprot:XP_001698154.1 predicted protein [Chlamydomonas reinhardtii]